MVLLTAACSHLCRAQCVQQAACHRRAAARHAACSPVVTPKQDQWTALFRAGDFSTFRQENHMSQGKDSKPKTESTAEKQRDIQKQQDRNDAGKPEQKPGQKDASQAGGRKHPEPPMPAQHLDKPGMEKDMHLKPQYHAPHYKGSGKLEGFATIVTGGDSGIGRAVAVLFAREGADVAIVYLEEHADAEETKQAVEAEGGKCLLIPGDVKDPAFCQ